jgi:hypothetical protein
MVPPLLRAVETTKARDVRYVQEEAMQSASSSSGKAKRLMKTHPVCPFMESPNLLRSLSAAIITHAEACAICANELSSESRGRVMPCLHDAFCIACIRRRADSSQYGTCPICRGRIESVGTVAVQRDRRPRGFDPAVEESLSAATVTRMRYGMATHSCTSVGVQRFERRSSWLYVPLIRAAFYMDTAHGVEGVDDASTNYVGDYVWTRIAHLVRADFVLRRIIANDVQVSGPNGYIAAGIQERLLHSP